MPRDAQDAFARVILQMAGDEAGAYELSAEEIADLDEADAEIRGGEFAESETVEAVLSKYRR